MCETCGCWQENLEDALKILNMCKKAFINLVEFDLILEQHKPETREIIQDIHDVILKLRKELKINYE